MAYCGTAIIIKTIDRIKPFGGSKHCICFACGTFLNQNTEFSLPAALLAESIPRQSLICREKYPLESSLLKSYMCSFTVHYIYHHMLLSYLILSCLVLLSNHIPYPLPPVSQDVCCPLPLSSHHIYCHHIISSAHAII